MSREIEERAQPTWSSEESAKGKGTDEKEVRGMRSRSSRLGGGPNDTAQGTDRSKVGPRVPDGVIGTEYRVVLIEAMM